MMSKTIKEWLVSDVDGNGGMRKDKGSAGRGRGKSVRGKSEDSGKSAPQFQKNIAGGVP